MNDLWYTTLIEFTDFRNKVMRYYVRPPDIRRIVLSTDYAILFYDGGISQDGIDWHEITLESAKAALLKLGVINAE